jgi:hypothetical protein
VRACVCTQQQLARRRAAYRGVRWFWHPCQCRWSRGALAQTPACRSTPRPPAAGCRPARSIAATCDDESAREACPRGARASPSCAILVRSTGKRTLAMICAFAPASSSRRTHSSCSVHAATYNGVAPFCVHAAGVSAAGTMMRAAACDAKSARGRTFACRSLSAPDCSSSRMQSAWPLAAAVYSGVVPSCVLQRAAATQRDKSGHAAAAGRPASAMRLCCRAAQRTLARASLSAPASSSADTTPA